jgi:hypothetical protein
MSLLAKIFEKLGLQKDKPASSVKPATAGAAGAAPTKKEPDKAYTPRQSSYTPGPSAPTPISEVDVVKKLEGLAAGSGLDWKVSIVDLLKLLDIDSSREARKDLAVELGCPADLMSDSAKMNTWLHKTVLKKIAENGGNIPRALLD